MDTKHGNLPWEGSTHKDTQPLTDLVKWGHVTYQKHIFTTFVSIATKIGNVVI